VTSRGVVWDLFIRCFYRATTVAWRRPVGDL